MAGLLSGYCGTFNVSSLTRSATVGCLHELRSLAYLQSTPGLKKCYSQSLWSQCVTCSSRPVPSSKQLLEFGNCCGRLTQRRTAFNTVYETIWAVMLAQDMGSCKLCFQPALPFAKQCLRFKGIRCRPLRTHYSVSTQARASSSQTDLFAKLGQVCTEMNQAPPSVVSC